ASLALALPALFCTSVSAETLSPTADTYSTLTIAGNPPVIKKQILNGASGGGGSLFLNKTHRAFIQFNAASQLAADGIGNADVVSAKLTIYFSSVIKPGRVDLHLATSAWEEKFKGTVPEPTIGGSTIGEIAAEDVVTKQFVSFDVTDVLRGWLT